MVAGQVDADHVRGRRAPCAPISRPGRVARAVVDQDELEIVAACRARRRRACASQKAPQRRGLVVAGRDDRKGRARAPAAARPPPAVVARGRTSGMSGSGSLFDRQRAAPASSPRAKHADAGLKALITTPPAATIRLGSGEFATSFAVRRRIQASAPIPAGQPMLGSWPRRFVSHQAQSSGTSENGSRVLELARGPDGPVRVGQRRRGRAGPGRSASSRIARRSATAGSAEVPAHAHRDARPRACTRAALCTHAGGARTAARSWRWC